MPYPTPPASLSPGASGPRKMEDVTFHLDADAFEFYVDLPANYTPDQYDAVAAEAIKQGYEMIGWDEMTPEPRANGMERHWLTPLSVALP